MNEATVVRMQRKAIFEALDRERVYQDAKRGPAHDRNLSLGDWILIMQEELEEARKEFVRGVGTKAALAEVLQVAAVGVACIENCGLVERWDNSEGR